MKKPIGLIGGMGPESTVIYYQEIINAFKSDKGDLNYPEVIVYSVNLSEFLGLMKIKAYDRIVDIMGARMDALKNAGAGFAALTANTPHLLFDRIQERSPIPLVSIVEATCRETIKKGLKRPGLLGTKFTMGATFYQEVFSRHGIDIVVPDPDTREIVNEKLFSEIELGIFRDETRQLLINIIAGMVKEEQIDSLILGCTEFPLILTGKEYCGIPMLDTTKIHVDAIVDYYRKA